MGERVVAERVRLEFEKRFRAYESRVRRIARLGRAPDPDDVVGVTWEQCWEEFPERYAKEREALAAGQSPEEVSRTFVKRLSRIALNRLIDHKRKAGLAEKRKKGKKAEETATEEALERAARRREVGLKYVESVPAGEDADPAALLERAFEERRLSGLLRRAMEELASEEPMQYLAIQTSLDDLSDAEAEELMMENRFAIYRLRQKGVLFLRRFFAERGYVVAKTAPRTRL